MTQIMYFIVDASHADFDQAKTDAELAQSNYVHPTSALSWRYNNSSPVTKAMVKVCGQNDTWWDGLPGSPPGSPSGSPPPLSGSPFTGYHLKDSALFLNVYYSTDHAAFATEMENAEWDV